MAGPVFPAVRFEEAIEFLRRRLNAPELWLSLLREADAAARDRAAGMSDALARDITAAILQAVENGAALPSFMTRWDELTARHGWDDQSGGRRAELTFRMLVAQAHAAGRWVQIQRLKKSRPYLRYVHVDPELTQPYSRIEHAHWHNIILPVDHAWWDIHYPPNGWNCRCYVMQLSERDLTRYGWTVTEDPPTATVIRMNRGRPVETPDGVDVGFGVHWGKVGLAIQQAR